MNLVEHEVKIATMEAAAKETKGWPIGQRVRAVGFQVVTREKLAERFACKAIEDAQNQAIKTKLLADFCGEQGKAWEELEAEGWYMDDRGSSFDIYQTSDKKPKKDQDPAVLISGDTQFWASGISWSMDNGITTVTAVDNKRHARKKSCTVKMEKLDEYMEEIPPRVMDSLRVAKECGLSKFKVAYPVLEDAPQKDPVLVAKLGDKLIEIDMWE